MRMITAERAQPGMVVATAVTDRKGRLLIGQDVSLTERHIQALKMWGVTQIEVEGDGPEEVPRVQLTPEVEARLTQEVQARFAGSDQTHPLIRSLFEVATDRAFQLAATGSGESS